MNTAKLKNWLLIRYTPLAHIHKDNLSCEHYVLPTENPLCLFGITHDDSRANPQTTRFTDGHRIATSDLTSFSKKKATTVGSEYTLLEMHPKYAEWLKAQDYHLTDNVIRYPAIGGVLNG